MFVDVLHETKTNDDRHVFLGMVKFYVVQIYNHDKTTLLHEQRFEDYDTAINWFNSLEPIES